MVLHTLLASYGATWVTLSAIGFAARLRGDDSRGQGMAMTAYHLIAPPTLLKKAKAEFETNTDHLKARVVLFCETRGARLNGCKHWSTMRPSLHTSRRLRRTASLACYGSPLPENSTLVVLPQQLGRWPHVGLPSKPLVVYTTSILGP